MAEAQARAVRAEYKRLLRFRQRTFCRQQQHDLVQAYYVQPALFWRAFKSGPDNAAMPADSEVWTAHFASVFNAPLPAGPQLPASITPGDVQAAREALLPDATPLPGEALSALNAQITEAEVAPTVAQGQGR